MPLTSPSDSYVNINEARFQEALIREMPGLESYILSTPSIADLELSLSLRVTTPYENFVNEEHALEQIQLIAERLRRDVLTKTGADRLVRAASEQAEQAEQEKARLRRLLDDRNGQILELTRRISFLEDQLSDNDVSDGEDGSTIHES